jgi:hypothetical protein
MRYLAEPVARGTMSDVRRRHGKHSYLGKARTRSALSWHTPAFYIFPVFALLAGIAGGVDLLIHGAAWQRMLGLALLGVSLGATVRIIRWLKLPVNPYARAQRARDQERRWDDFWMNVSQPFRWRRRD